jgi:hypothetical protein
VGASLERCHARRARFTSRPVLPRIARVGVVSRGSTCHARRARFESRLRPRCRASMRRSGVPRDNVPRPPGTVRVVAPPALPRFDASEWCPAGQRATHAGHGSSRGSARAAALRSRRSGVPRDNVPRARRQGSLRGSARAARGRRTSTSQVRGRRTSTSQTRRAAVAPQRARRDARPSHLYEARRAAVATQRATTHAS